MGVLIRFAWEKSFSVEQHKKQKMSLVETFTSVWCVSAHMSLSWDSALCVVKAVSTSGGLINFEAFSFDFHLISICILPLTSWHYDLTSSCQSHIKAETSCRTICTIMRWQAFPSLGVGKIDFVLCRNTICRSTFPEVTSSPRINPQSWRVSSCKTKCEMLSTATQCKSHIVVACPGMFTADSLCPSVTLAHLLIFPSLLAFLQPHILVFHDSSKFLAALLMF